MFIYRGKLPDIYHQMPLPVGLAVYILLTFLLWGYYREQQMRTRAAAQLNATTRRENEVWNAAAVEL
jgi:hypothetical protein